MENRKEILAYVIVGICIGLSIMNISSIFFRGETMCIQEYNFEGTNLYMEVPCNDLSNESINMSSPENQETEDKNCSSKVCRWNNKCFACRKITAINPSDSGIIKEGEL